MRFILRFTYVLLIFFGFSLGCGTVGISFDEKYVNQIQIGKTKKEDILGLFGKPFRTGIENGRVVWIYEYNNYSAFGPGSSRDLIVVFDDQGIVRTHQVLSSLP